MASLSRGPARARSPSSLPHRERSGKPEVPSHPPGVLRRPIGRSRAALIGGRRLWRGEGKGDWSFPRGSPGQAPPDTAAGVSGSGSAELHALSQADSFLARAGVDQKCSKSLQYAAD